MRGYRPTLELLTNTRPLTSPTSTSRVWPAAISRSRLLEVDRKPEILREVVQRPHRQHAHRGVGLNRDSCHGADRPVSTGGNKHIAA